MQRVQGRSSPVEAPPTGAPITQVPHRLWDPAVLTTPPVKPRPVPGHITPLLGPSPPDRLLQPWAHFIPEHYVTLELLYSCALITPFYFLYFLMFLGGKIAPLSRLAKS